MRTEAQEQEALVEWLRIKRIFFFAPYQENPGSFLNKQVAVIQGRKARKMGKMPGVSDLVVLLDTKILFIELKRARKQLKSGKMSTSHTKVSSAQESFITEVSKYPYVRAKVCYGFLEAKEFIGEELISN